MTTKSDQSENQIELKNTKIKVNDKEFNKLLDTKNETNLFKIEENNNESGNGIKTNIVDITNGDDNKIKADVKKFIANYKVWIPEDSEDLKNDLGDNLSKLKEFVIYVIILKKCGISKIDPKNDKLNQFDITDCSNGKVEECFDKLTKDSKTKGDIYKKIEKSDEDKAIMTLMAIDGYCKMTINKSPLAEYIKKLKDTMNSAYANMPYVWGKDRRKKGEIYIKKKNNYELALYIEKNVNYMRKTLMPILLSSVKMEDDYKVRVVKGVLAYSFSDTEAKKLLEDYRNGMNEIRIIKDLHVSRRKYGGYKINPFKEALGLYWL